jgi:excisionase family DNA binding protein
MAMAKPASNRMLDCVEAAEWLGCTERMIRSLIAQRQIPFVRVGRLVRIRPSDIEDYIAANYVEAVR